jgi:hypothetical protein
MSFSLFFYFIAFFNNLKKYQNIVSEIWLDKTGNEVRIVYSNKKYRTLRGNYTEEIILNSSLINPNQQTYLKKFSKLFN